MLRWHRTHRHRRGNGGVIPRSGWDGTGRRVDIPAATIFINQTLTRHLPGTQFTSFLDSDVARVVAHAVGQILRAIPGCRAVSYQEFTQDLTLNCDNTHLLSGTGGGVRG